ncbi:uncharacterized protein LOC131874332 [Cryptomeria japonica]|uniref:uncharacterized protein LOC131874332 n=1 Tax=Cryptomeria japonica TaxID=3369 RepID=UPI0027D9FFDE|nr:uncharacterized protein LOC131874332 [Cryptomeria japonica]
MTLVGNFLGSRPNIDIVRAFAKHKWALKGQVEITTMSKGALSLAFSCKEDMSRVLCDGPWLIGKSTLALKKWAPKMDLNESCFVQAPVWVRLSGLPLEFWVEDVFKGIASSFGELLSMDPITMARRRRADLKSFLEVLGEVVAAGATSFVGSREGGIVIIVGSLYVLYGHFYPSQTKALENPIDFELGIKLYRDKNISDASVKKFVKDEEEKAKLVKDIYTYFSPKLNMPGVSKSEEDFDDSDDEEGKGYETEAETKDDPQIVGSSTKIEK